MKVILLILFCLMCWIPAFFTWAVTWRIFAALLLSTFLAGVVFRRGR
jgi:hypothetical protein